jgi:hypothetical protein
MKSIHRLLIWIAWALGAALLTSCNLLNPATTEVVLPPQVHTEIAATVIMRLSMTAFFAPPSLTPTRTPHPTSTLAPSSTPVPTRTPYLSPTPLPPTLTPTFDPNATATRLPGVTFSDDFSLEVGWFTGSGASFEIFYNDETYRIRVLEAGVPIWSARQREFADVRLEVEADFVSGVDGYFGLMCRQVDSKNYYLLVVGPDGSYGIAKSKNGQLAFLPEASGFSAAIDPDEWITLAAECIGDRLTLFANGERLVSLQDADFASGSIGLVAGTRKEPEIDVRFDNFKALKP